MQPGKRLATWSAFMVDAKIVDGIVNGTGVAVQWLGARLRPLQSGFVRSYGALLAIGTVGLLAWIVARGL